MDNKKIVLQVSSKHIVLRIVLFAVAFSIAILAFTKAISSIGHKEPGWQLATASADGEIPLYSHDFAAYIYLEGSSGEIRRALSEFSSEYSLNLKRLYRLFDDKVVYEDYPNIALINANLGEKVIVSQELFNVLSFCYEKTLKGECNLFAGPYFNLSQTLANSQDFDVDYENQRLAVLLDVCSDLANFTFVLDSSDNSVLFDVSPVFKEALADIEYSGSFLNLNFMYHDLVVSRLSEILEQAGYSDFRIVF